MHEAQTGKLTGADRLTAKLLRWLPLPAFLLCALPLPLFALYRYFTVAEGAGEWMLVALFTFGVGALVGLLVALALWLYRRAWERRLRDRLASGGVRASELDWFAPELTAAERRALREIESRNLLLADAYRDTLAARLTAVRLLTGARRERESIERRLREAAKLSAAARAPLEQELAADRERLARVEGEAEARRVQSLARLQMIEAAASRGAGEEEARLALQRLELTHAQVPLSLEAARLERETRAQIDAELRRRSQA